MNGLDLFSGIGGISQALDPWVRTVAYCEADRHAQSVLLSRMARGEIHRAPIWDDVRTLSGNHFAGVPIDIIFGGFPCQDISTAGDGAGLDGARSGLFFEIARLADELRPSYIFLENVPAITVRGLDRVANELARLRYDFRWTIVSAKEVGARHLRKRWFLMAHADGESVRLSEPGVRRKKIHASGIVAPRGNSDANGAGMAVRWPEVRNEPEQPFGLSLLEGNDWDEYAAFFLRVDHGLPHRGHRIREMGNGVVPQQAREAFMRLSGIGG